MGGDAIGVLAERLDRLEQANTALRRECRRWRRGGVALALGALVMGIAGAAQLERTLRTVEATNFVLRDSMGRSRASLGFRSDGTPGLALMDELSRVRLALDLCADGAPGVNLYDKDGTLQTAFAIRPDGSPGLGFFDAQGKVRLSLDLGQKQTAPGLSLYDRSGTMRAAMAIRPDDTSGLGLFDAQGRVVLSLDSETVGKVSLPPAGAPAGE